VRQGSPTFGQWVGVQLNGETPQQLFVPAGFAHGFCVMSPTALFLYKCGDYYAPEHECGLRWDDPDLAIEWPVDTPLLSDRDREFPTLKEIAAHRLPPY
jgi:dTDP-4-dehydrorhamnose 3,5-epimerase